MRLMPSAKSLAFKLRHYQKLTPESDATPTEAAELAWIRSDESGIAHMVSFSHRLVFSRRFLAKVALGLGANLFGPKYLETPYVNELRRALWSTNEDDDAGDLRGTDFMNNSALTGSRLNGIRGTWGLIFMAMPKAFGLVIGTPAGRSMAIQIADEPSLWSNPAFGPYHRGLFHFVVPERSHFSDAVSMLDFVSHKTGRRTNPIMAAIERFRSDRATLPPLQ